MPKKPDDADLAEPPIGGAASVGPDGYYTPEYERARIERVTPGPASTGTRPLRTTSRRRLERIRIRSGYVDSSGNPPVARRAHMVAIGIPPKPRSHAPVFPPGARQTH
jgi:hypothetical protein